MKLRSGRQGLLPAISRQNSRPEKDLWYGTRWSVASQWLTVIALVVMCALSLYMIRMVRSNEETPGLLQGGSGGHAVFAVATNTTAERVAVFVQSWATYAPSHSIILFIEHDIAKDGQVGQLLKDYKVRVVKVERPALVDDVDDEEELPKPGRLALQSLQRVLKYMEKMNEKYTGVALVLTAGDVVLQGDPFQDTSVKQYIPRQGIVLALQGGPQLGAVKVSQSSDMMDMLHDCFGSTMADKMRHLGLINGNVVIGAQKGIVDLLLLVTDVLATRTRERCLTHHRADLAAIQYSVGEFGRDPRNVDFAFSLRDHVTSTVYGALYGLPAKIDSKGFLRRMIPKGGVRRGPTPTVISQYSSNEYLSDMYVNRFRFYGKEIEFDYL